MNLRSQKGTSWKLVTQKGIERYIFSLVILLLINTSLFSMGAFNLFNGRNRPDLNWFEINSDHTKIV